MKKLAFGAVGSFLAAVSVVLVPSVAGATASGSGTSVSIDQYADFNFAGTQLDVGLQVRCSGGAGIVNVTADQDYPDNGSPLGAHGTGVQDVACDGKTHYVTATIVGSLYDGGKAYVKATVTAPSGSDTASREVSVRAV